MHNAQFLSQSFTYFIFFLQILAFHPPQPLQILIISPHTIPEHPSVQSFKFYILPQFQRHIQHASHQILHHAKPVMQPIRRYRNFCHFVIFLIDLAYPWFIFPLNFLNGFGSVVNIFQIRNKLLCHRYRFAQKLFCLLPELFF